MNKKHLAFLLLFTTSLCPYYSQHGQDKYVESHFFPTKTDGVFVDIGASDGKTFSDSLYFEQKGWKGICVEPMKERFEKLSAIRSSKNIFGCVAPTTGTKAFTKVYLDGKLSGFSGLTEKYDPKHKEHIKKKIEELGGSTEEIKISCFNIMDILKDVGVTHIDFLIIDTEGGELDILKSIDFDTVFVDVITVENNYNSPEFKEFLESKDFVFIKRLECDEIYRHRKTL